ncbi:MAG: MATE family efflux transporter [Candidatus Methanomethylophilaceae archaeon]
MNDHILEKDFTKRFTPNLVMNLIALLISALVGLLLVPYFIDELGIAAYGIVPIATSVTSYVTLASDSIVNSVYRYLAVAIQHNQIDNAKKTYSTAVLGLLKVVIALIPVVLVVSYLSPYIFNIGGSTLVNVQLLFLGVLGSVLIITWSNIFTTVLMSNNRLDLQGMVKIIQLLVQVGIIVVLFSIDGPSLVNIGIAYFIAGIVFAVMCYALSKKISPELRMERNRYSSDHFKEICSIGVWNLVNNIGNLLFIQMSLMLANIFYGSASGGEFSIVASLVSIVVALSATMTNLFTPITYHNYSAGYYDDMNRMCRSAVKVVGLFVAPVLAFICVFSPQILTIWVGESFVNLSNLIWIMLIMMVGFEAIAPVYPIALARLKVRVPAITTVFFGAFNIVLATVFYYLTDWGLEGIAIAWTISMLIKNCIFFPWYHAKITGLDGTAFHRSLLYGYAGMAASLVMYLVVDYVFEVPANILILFIVAVLVFVVYIALIMKFLLSKEEKLLVRASVPGIISKFIPKWIL